MNFKRILSLLFVFVLLLSTAACGNMSSERPVEQKQDPVTLTLWVYPMGKWETQTAVDSLLKAYSQEFPDVTIETKLLHTETADVDISTAIEAGDCPDLLFGSLSQLRHAQRRGGIAVDLSALCKGATYRAVKYACTDSDGLFYALPAVMDVTYMAINYEMFKDANALQYIDEMRHTWTTEDFLKAVKALKDADQTPDVLALYCGGQSGDDGTRALVTNLYGGSFTDENHTRYTLDSEENITALTTLQGLRGVIFDKDIVAEDENILFAQEQLAMSLSWHADHEPVEKFTAFPMAYPANDGSAKLPGEVWGFSCFDNGDAGKIDAAISLLRYLNATDSVYSKLVSLCGHYPVRDLPTAESDILASFMPMMDSYESYTPGFAVARTEWYELLKRLGDGADVALEVDTFCTNANTAARQMK